MKLQKLWKYIFEGLNEISIPLILFAFFGIPTILIGYAFSIEEKETKGIEIAHNVYIREPGEWEVRYDTIYEKMLWEQEWNHLNFELSECSSVYRSLLANLESTDPSIGNNELKIEEWKRDTTLVCAKIDSLAELRNTLDKDKRRYSNKIDCIIVKLIIKPKEEEL